VKATLENVSLKVLHFSPATYHSTTAPYSFTGHSGEGKCANYVLHFHRDMVTYSDKDNKKYFKLIASACGKEKKIHLIHGCPILKV
jgi:hypothetical protein